MQKLFLNRISNTFQNLLLTFYSQKLHTKLTSKVKKILLMELLQTDAFLIFPSDFLYSHNRNS